MESETYAHVGLRDGRPVFRTPLCMCTGPTGRGKQTTGLFLHTLIIMHGMYTPY